MSGVVDCVEGEVLLGVLDCGLADCELVSGVVDCGVVDELLCATTQTADSSRTAVIRDTLLIYILLKVLFGLLAPACSNFGSGVIPLEYVLLTEVCLFCAF